MKTFCYADVCTIYLAGFGALLSPPCCLLNLRNIIQLELRTYTFFLLLPIKISSISHIINLKISNIRIQLNHPIKNVVIGTFFFFFFLFFCFQILQILIIFMSYSCSEKVLTIRKSLVKLYAVQIFGFS